MKVCITSFSYTTKSSTDNNSPVEMVLKELNETIDAENVISIEMESSRGEFRYDYSDPYDYNSVDRSRGHRPLTVTLTVFYRA